MSERVHGNRADRRRRGMTRSRMKRTGSIASAGVLVSAGLFGAYVGNPRLQRAYASPVCAGAVTVTGPGDDTLVAALDDSTVTCIHVQGEITLYASLPVLDDDSWSGGPRDSGTGLTLYGLGGDDTIDGALAHGGLAIVLGDPLDDTVHLSLSGLTMANLQSGSVGALSVYIFDTQPEAVVEVDLAHSTFADDSALSGWGGAVRVRADGRHVTVSAFDDTFVGNYSGGEGGAIAAYSFGSDVTFHLCGSYFARNSASSNGGAIWAYSTAGGDFYVNDTAGCVGTTVFADNTARGTGGAISTNLDAQISDAEFIENVSRVGLSGRGGGAIYGHTVASNRNTFTGNTSYGGSGGAIASGGTVSSTDDSFAQNVTNFDGGAIYTFGGLNATGSLIGGFNDAQVSGGGVFSKGPVVLDSVVLSQNLAGSRGGGIAVLGASTTMVDSTVSRNMSFRDGGGLYSNRAVAVTSSAIVNNEALYVGGGIRGASATLTNSYVGANRAPYWGGIWLATGSRHLGLYFSTVYDDTATGFGSFPEIGAGSLTAVGSVVANEWTDNTWLATTVDDTAFITDDSLGSWTPGVGSHVLAPGQGLALAPRDDTLIPGHAGRTPLASSPLATAVAAGGFAPATSPKPTVLLDQLEVTRVAPFTIGARQFVVPPPPSPPAPPSEPPSAPRDPRAVAGDRRAVVSWVAPASSGSFPVTNYQVVASPGGAQCLAAAPALSCTVTGLANGTTYAFRVRALNGAGWSPESAPSNEVTPHGDPAILITGSREGREVKVVGATTGIESSTVVPRFRFPGQTEYQTGLVRPTIEASGAFRWSRVTSRTIYVYFMADGLRSNRIALAREG